MFFQVSFRDMSDGLEVMEKQRMMRCGRSKVYDVGDEVS